MIGWWCRLACRGTGPAAIRERYVVDSYGTSFPFSSHTIKSNLLKKKELVYEHVSLKYKQKLKPG